MNIYKLTRMNRLTGLETVLIRLKAQDYDDAIRIAERLEVFPGVFGNDTIEPNRDMILMYQDRS